MAQKLDSPRRKQLLIGSASHSLCQARPGSTLGLFEGELGVEPWPQPSLQMDGAGETKDLRVRQAKSRETQTAIPSHLSSGNATTHRELAQGQLQRIGEHHNLPEEPTENKPIPKMQGTNEHHNLPKAPAQNKPIPKLQ